MGKSQGVTGYQRVDLAPLGDITLEKLEPRRHVIEKLFNAHQCALRGASCAHVARLPPDYLDLGACSGAFLARGDGRSCPGTYSMTKKCRMGALASSPAIS